MIRITWCHLYTSNPVLAVQEDLTKVGSAFNRLINQVYQLFTDPDVASAANALRDAATIAAERVKSTVNKVLAHKQHSSDSSEDQIEGEGETERHRNISSSFMIIKGIAETNEIVYSTQSNFQKYCTHKSFNQGINNVFYSLLLCLIENKCVLNKKVFWLMFTGDSNTRNTVQHLVYSLSHKSNVQVIDDITNRLLPHLKCDVQWMDREWIIIANEYIFRVSLRFEKSGNLNRTLNYIFDDYNNIADGAPINIQNVSSMWKYVSSVSKPDIMYVSQGLWGIQGLKQNTEQSNGWTHNDIANLLKYWQDVKNINVFWVTNFRIKHHGTIRNELIEYDVKQTKINAERCGVPVFSLWDTITGSIYQQIGDYHYGSKGQNIYQKFVVESILRIYQIDGRN
eukprot:153994_1